MLQGLTNVTKKNLVENMCSFHRITDDNNFSVDLAASMSYETNALLFNVLTTAITRRVDALERCYEMIHLCR